MSELKISIIMATYNRAHLIVETLQSIQNQTYKNWECLIIDDGGIDNTLEVIAPILDKDLRFKYYSRSNNYKKGLPGCRNYGLDLAAGEFIIFFDDDDIVHPQNLELCVKELSKNEIDFCRYKRKVFTDDFHYNFDKEKNYTKFQISTADIDKMIDHRLPFNSCAVMWKKNCFNSNKFIETLMYAEEWELYSRILSNKIVGVSINKTLFYGRKHPNSNTGEFWNHNPIRVNSKKEAIRLIVDNLVAKDLLSDYLFNYMVGLAIFYRDKKLLSYIIGKRKISYAKKLYLQFKYILFPVWKVYKKTIKKIKKY